MKRIYTLIIFILMVLLLFLTITQCSQDNEEKEKKLITILQKLILPLQVRMQKFLKII